MSLKKWEYTIQYISKNYSKPFHTLVKELNNFGEEGWEIFKLRERKDDWLAFFKRPKE